MTEQRHFGFDIGRRRRQSVLCEQLLKVLRIAFGKRVHVGAGRVVLHGVVPYELYVALVLVERVVLAVIEFVFDRA